MISVYLIVKDEAADLPGALESVRFAHDVHVLDSGSTDATCDIARDFGAKVAVRAFDDYGSQRNWALANLRFARPFVLQLDADERVTPELRASIERAAAAPGGRAAFSVSRRDHYFGRPLRFAQAARRFVRLFRPETVRFDRLVHASPRVCGSIGKLAGRLDHHPFSKGLDHWLGRHERYATLEALQACRVPFAPSLRRALFSPDPVLRREHRKKLAARLPCRALFRFAYFYLVRCGLLDGRAGLAVSLLQARYETMVRAALAAAKSSSPVQAIHHASALRRP